MKPRAIAISVAAIVVLAFPAGASAAKGKDKGEDVTVMSRNVYLGADLSPAIEAPDIPSAIDGAGAIFNDVVRTNFPERAIPLAKEIEKAKPDLVGLQEVANWQTQTPSDLGGPPIGPGTVPASTPFQDFLAILEGELSSKYRVVATQDEFVGELPADVNGVDEPGTVAGEDMDVRLTMRDVILARKGVKASKVKMAHYETRFETAVGGVPIGADRGWISTQAQVGDAKFKFVNTHLEAFGDDTIREAQAKELIDAALKGKGQVVLVGDLNSGLKKPHKIKGTDQLAFKALDKFGMFDAGAIQSCCYPAELNDPKFKFDHTVDHVLTKPKVKVDDAFVTGNDKGEITPSGVWPSDHGGVVSTILIP